MGYLYGRTVPTTAVGNKFFCKDFRLDLPRGLCCNCLDLPIWCESSHRQYVTNGHPLYLWTPNFELHTIFTCHKVLFFILPSPQNHFKCKNYCSLLGHPKQVMARFVPQAVLCKPWTSVHVELPSLWICYKDHQNFWHGFYKLPLPVNDFSSSTILWSIEKTNHLKWLRVVLISDPDHIDKSYLFLEALHNSSSSTSFPFNEFLS